MSQEYVMGAASGLNKKGEIQLSEFQETRQDILPEQGWLLGCNAVGVFPDPASQ